MIQLTVFSQGKKRIVTFSYDDGPEKRFFCDRLYSKKAVFPAKPTRFAGRAAYWCL